MRAPPSSDGHIAAFHILCDVVDEAEECEDIP